MAKNPEDIKNEREQGGIEYAVMRSSDGALLWDDDLNGVYQSWEDDEENASWVDSEKDALRLADLAGLLPGGRLAKGVRDHGTSLVLRGRPQGRRMKPFGIAATR